MNIGREEKVIPYHTGCSFRECFTACGVGKTCVLYLPIFRQRRNGNNLHNVNSRRLRALPIVPTRYRPIAFAWYVFVFPTRVGRISKGRFNVTIRFKRAYFPGKILLFKLLRVRSNVVRACSLRRRVVPGSESASVDFHVVTSSFRPIRLGLRQYLTNYLTAEADSSAQYFISSCVRVLSIEDYTCNDLVGSRLRFMVIFVNEATDPIEHKVLARQLVFVVFWGRVNVPSTLGRETSVCVRPVHVLHPLAPFFCKGHVERHCLKVVLVFRLIFVLCGSDVRFVLHRAVRGVVWMVLQLRIIFRVSVGHTVKA